MAGDARQPRCAESLVSVSTNVHVRDLDLADLNAVDGRRLDVVADGFSLWHGAQVAIDTTLVSILLCTAAPGGNDGAALEVAKRRKERAPELVGEGGLAR